MVKLGRIATDCRSQLRHRARQLFRKSGLHQLRMSLALERTAREYKHLRKLALARPRTAAGSAVVLLPTDPVLLTSSTGDDAMYRTALQQIRAVSPASIVHIPVLTEHAEHAARALGMRPHRFAAFSPLEPVLTTLLAVRPSHVLLLGADGLDGAHDPSFSLSMFALADLSACAGVPGTVTGFSVSRRADPRLKAYFASANRQLKILVRDPVSLQRFQQLYGRAELCSDMAFLLRPAESPPPALADAFAWLARQRREGRRVLGLNLHPLLYDGYSPQQQREHLEQICQGLVAAATAIVLIAHDHRQRAADIHCHAVIAPPLRAALGEAFFDLGARTASHDIKLFVSQLDGLVSGRMHLSIAALSQGVPTLGINYRDKMEGLARLFGLDDYIVDKEAFLQPDDFARCVRRFVAKLDTLRPKVQAAAPRARELAQLNFEPLRQALSQEHVSNRRAH